MRTRARVHDVREGRAWLACEAATGACTACAAGRGCALRLLGPSGGGLLEVPAQGPGGTLLARGDALTIEVSDRELLRAAVAAYVPPLIGLLAGPLVATLLSASDRIAVAAAGAGLVLGWAVSRACLRRSPPHVELCGPERG
jgi:positive regulator of sigma E activity